MDDEPRGKLDLVACLYVLFGVPGIVAFVVIVFGLVKACNLPA